MLTISAFYFGETLHAKKTSAWSEASRNIALNLSFASISSKDAPATTIDCFFPDLFCFAIF